MPQGRTVDLVELGPGRPGGDTAAEPPAVPPADAAEIRCCQVGGIRRGHGHNEHDAAPHGRERVDTDVHRGIETLTCQLDHQVRPTRRLPLGDVEYHDRALRY